MAEKNAAGAARGVDTNRRRFLGGTALAAFGAIIGDVIPLSGNGGMRKQPRRLLHLPRPQRRRDRNI
jgi:hypothetical protein